MAMKQVSAKQNVCIFITFLISSIPMISGYNNAKQDIWLSYLLAFAAAIPLMLICVRICSLFPEKNLFEILGEVFGKKAGMIITGLYILYILSTAGISLRISSEFIHVISLSETPQWITLAFFFVLCAYGARKDYEGVARFSAFILPIILLMLVGFILLSINMYDVNNFEPIDRENFTGIADTAWTAFAYPFGELVISYVFFSDMKLKKGKGYLAYIILISVAFLSILAMIFNNILVLGAPSMTRLYFPTHMAHSIINLGAFSGTETLSSSIFFIASIVKCIVCIIAAARGLYFIAPKTKKASSAVVTLFCAVCCIFALLIFRNTMQMFNFFYYSRYYSILFQLFPIILWLGAEIKAKKAGISNKQTGINKP